MSGSEGPLKRFMRSDLLSDTSQGDDSLLHVGEVISSSTTEFVAEARCLDKAPSFGQFVQVTSEVSVIGIVYNVYSQSIEPNRRPTAYGKTQEQLRKEQPQIFELLRTEFQVLIVGYFDGHNPVYVLPPQPTKIHSFVLECDDKEVCSFTVKTDFLRSIINASNVPVDELLVAVLRVALQARNSDQDYLIRMGKELSRLVGDDYDRLSSIIRRASS